MKLIYSHLKKFLPSLDIAPQNLRDDLTMIGHFANYYEKLPDNDFIIDLDIKANRGDGLSYYGLARDLSVYYNIPLVSPIDPDFNIPASDYQLPISVTSPDVRRVMALKISDTQVQTSPQWLVDFCNLHNIHSVNNIVDLTNYVMFMYGIPNHAFDAGITSDSLIWENNQGKNSEFTTLDGTALKLSSQNLVISNPTEVLSTDLVGGKKSGINNNTNQIILEVAVYNRVRIRKDSKELKTVTEASTRLEKDLDSNLIPTAMNYLASLIISSSGGHISSQLYDYYPQVESESEIEFDLNMPALYSGIDIPTDFSLQVLKQLGCSIENINNTTVQATPPSIRKDISLPEDLVEEVVRFFGYNKIPSTQALSPKTLPDITPGILYLNLFIKKELAQLGYDEIRSWPLIKQESLIPNLIPQDSEPVYTQNSINSDYPVLRTSIISSLKSQQDQYQRFKVPQVQFFEIGKVFNQSQGQYHENYSLGIYDSNQSQLSSNLEKLSDRLKINGGNIQSYNDQTGFYVEINLDELVKSVDLAYIKDQPKSNDHENSGHSVELTSQIITLDANIILDQQQDPRELIKEYSQKIGENLWQLIISDIYHDPKSDKYRYTFRASYYNIDDKTAKDIHLTVFNLK